MMHKVMLGTALCAALGLSLGVEAASAKAADPSAHRSLCRMTAAAPPLKLLAENGLFTPVERMTRRAIYTPVPSLTAAREQALLTLERQPKPVSLIVGVGF
jgi:hypothetical protein